MIVYEIKTAPNKTYFVRLLSSDRSAYGYKLVYNSGVWTMSRGRYDAADLRNFPDKFPVICNLSMDVFKKPIMRAIVDAKHQADNQTKEGQP